ncbi:hypothetical protein SAMN05216436_115130 [bacterium A37T11]|nr:hypothetical protein SAMN05216436_115130 [bacterium A37T11]
MAKINSLWLPLLVLLLGHGVAPGKPAIKRWIQRPTLPQIYRAEIGVHEATSHNDGPRIAEYLRYCGLIPGSAWCAAFVSWCHGKAGYPQPRNSWAAALFPDDRIVHNPKEGDVFGIYFQELHRIGHCGFVESWNHTWCLTVEGNTGPAPEGVYRKRRSIRTIKAVARWVNQ